MDHYRRKPVVVEALPIAEVFRLWDTEDLPEWAIKAEVAGLLTVSLDAKISLRNAQGGCYGTDQGIWLLAEKNGTLSFCQGDVFNANYERVAERGEE